MGRLLTRCGKATPQTAVHERRQSLKQRTKAKIIFRQVYFSSLGVPKFREAASVVYIRATNIDNYGILKITPPDFNF
ncbi:hypothetical protein MR642_05905 [bacterium]|nr:hypothetical protein [bacterium]